MLLSTGHYQYGQQHNRGCKVSLFAMCEAHVCTTSNSCSCVWLVGTEYISNAVQLCVCVCVCVIVRVCCGRWLASGVALLVRVCVCVWWSSQRYWAVSCGGVVGVEVA